MTADSLKFLKLRPWQPPIVEASIEGLRTGNFLNGSGLGTGKSFCTMAALQALNVDALFLCRLAVKETVREIAEGHFGMRKGQVIPINLEMVRTGNTEFGHWYDGERNENTGACDQYFRWTLGNRVLVWDECHNASALDSASSQMLKDARNQEVKVLMLSGTAADHPMRMRAIGYALGLHHDYDFWQWAALHGASEKSWDFGLPAKMLKTRKGRELLCTKQNEAMAKIHAQLTKAGRMIRLRTSDIPGFPKSSIHPLCVDFNSEELTAIYEEMRFELEQLKQKGTGKTQLEIMMRARQKAELLMVPGWAEMNQEAIAEGENVVFFLNFTASVRSLAERLNTDCIYTGENLKTRDEHHRAFMADEKRTIITNIAAAGESLGFQDKHGRYPRTGIISSNFWATQMNQALGRLPRDGAQTPSKYYITFPRGTIAEQAYKACKRRTELYGVFNGDMQFRDEDLQEGLPI